MSVSGEESDNSQIMQNNTLKDLKKKRGVIKGKLTIFKKYLTTLNLNNLSAEQIIDLQMRTDRIKTIFNSFESVQDHIETITDKYEEQLAEREIFESSYFDAISNATQGLSKYSKPEIMQRDSIVGGNKTSNSEYIKYPDISLPNFDGDVKQWIEFRDTFDVLINQSNLKNIQKFKYLKSCLKGCALEVIGALEFSNENYDLAWKLLCERYNNPRIIVNNHLKALFNIDNVPYTPNALRSLVDSISKHLRTIKILNIDIENWDVLVIFLLTSKLDRQLQHKWEERINTKEIPTLQEFKSFLRSQADLLDTLGTEDPVRTNMAKKTFVATTQAVQQDQRGKPNNRCPNCSDTHYINQCPRFLTLNAESRIRLIKRLRLCLNCFGTNHMIQNCRATRCRTCKGKHHTLLHDPSRQKPPLETNNVKSTLFCNPQTQQAEPQSQVVNTTLVHDNQQQYVFKSVLLSTALIYVADNNNQLHKFRVLLDSGSQSSFITQRAYDKLCIPKYNANVEVRGFNDALTNISQYCKLKIQSQDKCFSINISCFIAPTLCKITQLHDINKLHIPNQYKLADEYFYMAGEIDMIIGAEHFYNVLCVGQHRLGKGLPILQKTRFGWVLSGAFTPSLQTGEIIRCNFVTNKSDGSDFQKLPDDEMKICEKVFSEHSRTTEGNFIVSLPLKQSPRVLGKSRHIAYKRLKTLEHKFIKNPDLKEKYIQTMREFERSGHMKKIVISPEFQYNYLPHHAVINYQKETTPIRIVYDASCPTDTGLSVNDIQLKGKSQQDELINILYRYRSHRYIICADIEKMYRMIYLNPQQQKLQCILWRENPNEPISVYVLTTLSFGLKAAPYLATRCLQQLSLECSQQCPVAAKAIARDFYMDDFIHGNDDKTQLIETAKQVDTILNTAKFKLRKWCSNSQEILDEVGNHDSNKHDNTQPKKLITNFGDNSSKILGLAWNQSNDCLTFTLEEPPTVKLTKRIVLSSLSSIFDPLGLLTPVLITGKLFMQRLFTGFKTGWDDPLPEYLCEEWERYRKMLSILNTLSIPRHVIIDDVTDIEIHGFADSSLSAYGAAIYIKSTNRHNCVVVRLLGSRSRVARNETIPCLELRAAVLLTHLYKRIKNAINKQISQTYLWSDSNIVLSWINSNPEKLKCFQANRVKEIQAITNKDDWHWVSSQDNPADLITRGLPADKFRYNNLWWQGPTWLHKPNSEWPNNKPPPINTETTIVSCTSQDLPDLHESPNTFINKLFNRYSSDQKLIRVFSYILRFIHNIRNKQSRLAGCLSVDETIKATLKLTQFSQIESFPNEYMLLKQNKPIPKRSNIKDLNPFFDNGVIRVGGRLSNSLYAYDKKHPLILHHKHNWTKLIMRNEHERLFHAGPQLLLASVRERVWPTHGKSLAKRVVHECVACFRANPKPTTPIMGNLPKDRVTPSTPFTTTGIDYAGPFLVRDRRGRGYKCYKCYICIFVCFSTKAIHIELVSSLEAQAFIVALRRFTARRGKPRTLVSDNSTTFKGANKELIELYNFIKDSSDKLISFSSNEGINWKFIPVYSPHMGGIHEAAVKSCKYHLKRVVGKALLTYEEFMSYLVQIEGILNSRPLCPIPSTDSDDVFILTPAHFLIGRSLNLVPDYEYEEVPTHKLTHFQQIQQLHQDFWRRWSRDYISLLQQRVKWREAKGSSLKPGTIVIIKDDRLPPCYWKLGRITQKHDGRDDVTRVATIKTSQGIVKRAFNNICVLPINGIE